MQKLILFSISILLFSCGGQLIDKDENNENNPESVDLVRKKQRTLRYNCSGELVSNEIETINHVSKRMEVHPDDDDDLWGFSATIRGNTKGHLEGSKGIFTIDIAPTVFNLRVYEGLNEVEYKFNYCDDVRVRTITDDDGNESKETYCASSVYIGEEGKVYLQVTETVEMIPGEREIRRTGSSCES